MVGFEKEGKCVDLKKGDTYWISISRSFLIRLLESTVILIDKLTGILDCVPPLFPVCRYVVYKTDGLLQYMVNCLFTYILIIVHTFACLCQKEHITSVTI